jgi:hypothetical protein
MITNLVLLLMTMACSILLSMATGAEHPNVVILFGIADNLKSELFDRSKSKSN